MKSSRKAMQQRTFSILITFQEFLNQLVIPLAVSSRFPPSIKRTGSASCKNGDPAGEQHAAGSGHHFVQCSASAQLHLISVTPHLL